jgi:translin
VRLTLKNELSPKKILKALKSELKSKSSLREKMLTNSRKINHLSKESIMLLHRGNIKKAERLVVTAEKILKQTKKILASAPDLQNSGPLYNASQEYAEASILIKLEKNGKYPTPSEIGVTSEAYVLGLADVVGELRRRALNAINDADVEAAERHSRLMETIYSELVNLNEHAFSVLPNLRHKCDVARRLVEITAGDVIIERRRKHLETSLKRMENRVAGRPSNPKRRKP